MTGGIVAQSLQAILLPFLSTFFCFPSYHTSCFHFALSPHEEGLSVHRTGFRLICFLTWIQTVIPTVIIMLKDFIFWNSPRNFAWFVTQFSKTFKIYFTMIEHGTMIPLQASKRPLYDLLLHNTHMQLCNVNSNQK